MHQAARAGLFPKVKINRTYDVPYLAGYSTSGKTIYVDRRLPDRLDDLLPYLVLHERIEKWALNHEDMDYQRAHALATLFEHQAVRQAGMDPDRYEAQLKPWIRHCDDERIKRVPADLDLTPYEDEDDRRILRELMQAAA